ncbi:MAG: flagellar motor switch protein FliM [Pseudomonadota bacterium]
MTDFTNPLQDDQVPPGQNPAQPPQGAPGADPNAGPTLGEAVAEATETTADYDLDQAQVDNLLDDDDYAGISSSHGIRTIIESGMVSYGRLPMLEVVFDRLIRLMSTSLRNLTSDNVEITMEGFQTLKFEDFTETVDVPCMLAVFKAEEWDNFGLMSLDSGLVYSIIDVLLGGRAKYGNSPQTLANRPFTTIERSLIMRLCNVVLNDLSISFDPLSTVNMRFDRLETLPKFASIASPNNAAVIATFFVQLDTRGGNLSIVFPLATLEPIRELLLQMYLGEKFGRDSIWETHLAEQLWKADIILDAVLDEFSMPLGNILEWEIGSFVALDTTPNDPIELRSGDVPLFMAEMGHSAEYVATKIIGPIAANKPQ